MHNAIDLEIPLSHFLNVANFKKMVDIGAEKGYLVKDGAATEWSFTGFKYRDGAPVLHGPPARGVPLDAALERPRDEALAAAAEVVRALAALEGVAEKIEIYPDSVWLLEDGGVLFLPAEVFRKIRLLSDDEYKARCSRLNDPYATEARGRLSHCVGAMLYRALTGVYPYDGKDLDEIHARIRQRKVMPPHLLFPGLQKDISDLFCRFFEKKVPLSIAEWKQTVDDRLSGVATESQSGEEEASLAGQREKLVGHLDRGLKRRLFLEKYGKTLIIAAVVVVAAGITAGFIVSNAMKPRLTAGFPPLKVVESYYQAIDALNPELMRDCVKGNTAAGEIQQTEIMFISTRQVEYYTHQNYRLRASEWLKLGRPRVNPPSYVEGVAGLTVKEISGGSEPVYEAEYERWEHVPVGGGGKGFYEEGFRVKDRLTLVKDSQGWLIDKIDRLENVMFYRSEKGYQPPVPSTAK